MSKPTPQEGSTQIDFDSVYKTESLALKVLMVSLLIVCVCALLL